MPGKGGDTGGMGSKAINALAGGVAAYVARKAIVFAWTKTTGREPPDKAEDREVAIGEAVIWAMLVGAGVAAAKVLATRLTSKRSHA
jgi:Protein of unknown function (DUF4235)